MLHKMTVLEVFATPEGGRPVAVTASLLRRKSERVSAMLADDGTEFTLHIYWQGQHAQISATPQAGRAIVSLLLKLRRKDPNAILAGQAKLVLRGAEVRGEIRPENLRETVFNVARETGIPPASLQVFRFYASNEQMNWLTAE